VDQHRTLIEKDPQEVYAILIDPDQLPRWCPLEEISVKKVSPGEFGLGTKFHFSLQFRIQLDWDSEVIYLQKDQQIVYRFLNGIFEGGVEIWDLKKTGSGTEVIHILVHQIHRWIYKVGWYLLGGKRKHHELTQLALFRLKSLLEGVPS